MRRGDACLSGPSPEHSESQSTEAGTLTFAPAVFSKMPYHPLHAFKKKSRRGIKTPQGDIDLIKRRLKDAETDNATREAEDKI